MAEVSTKPYLIRAIHEWCSDQGYTPYLAVSVDEHTRVPLEYVKGGEIVLNVSLPATSHLRLGNDWIEFQARFGGVARDIAIPVHSVSAIYARETGHGMAFEVVKPLAEAQRPKSVDDSRGQREHKGQPSGRNVSPLKKGASIRALPAPKTGVPQGAARGGGPRSLSSVPNLSPPDDGSADRGVPTAGAPTAGAPAAGDGTGMTGAIRAAGAIESSDSIEATESIGASGSSKASDSIGEVALVEATAQETPPGDSEALDTRPPPVAAVSAAPAGVSEEPPTPQAAPSRVVESSESSKRAEIAEQQASEIPTGVPAQNGALPQALSPRIPEPEGQSPAGAATDSLAGAEPLANAGSLAGAESLANADSILAGAEPLANADSLAGADSSAGIDSPTGADSFAASTSTPGEGTGAAAERSGAAAVVGALHHPKETMAASSVVDAASSAGEVASTDGETANSEGQNSATVVFEAGSAAIKSEGGSASEPDQVSHDSQVLQDSQVPQDSQAPYESRAAHDPQAHPPSQASQSADPDDGPADDGRGNGSGDRSRPRLTRVK